MYLSKMSSTVVKNVLCMQKFSMFYIIILDVCTKRTNDNVYIYFLFLKFLLYLSIISITWISRYLDVFCIYLRSNDLSLFYFFRFIFIAIPSPRYSPIYIRIYPFPNLVYRCRIIKYILSIIDAPNIIELF